MPRKMRKKGARDRMSEYRVPLLTEAARRVSPCVRLQTTCRSCLYFQIFVLAGD